MLRGVNALVQGFRRIIVQDGNGLLRDNWPRIYSGIDEMHRATGDLHAMIQRLLPGFQSGKRREQGRVDVHDATFKCPQEISLQHTHETSEHDQIHFRISQRVHVRALGVFIELRPEFPRRDKSRRKISFSRVLKNSGVLDIAQHNRDLRGEASSRNRIRNSREV